MTESTPDRNSWNDNVIAQFHAGDQRIADTFDRQTLLLLHTVGARSGQPRVSPLYHFQDGDLLLIVASAGGTPSNPAWYYNILANPQVTIERWEGDELATFQAIATPAEGEEYRQLWSKFVAINPTFARYQTMTTRVIPLIVLQRA